MRPSRICLTTVRTNNCALGGSGFYEHWWVMFGEHQRLRDNNQISGSHRATNDLNVIPIKQDCRHLFVTLKNNLREVAPC